MVDEKQQQILAKYCVKYTLVVYILLYMYIFTHDVNMYINASLIVQTIFEN